MLTASPTTLLVGLSFLGLGAHAAWPIKTTDYTNGGDDCDASTDQYLKIEAHDFHDHPMLILRWRQTTGPCGEAVDESNLMSWDASYDGSAENAEDDPPTEGDSGRVQLNMFVCAPFGEYEIDLDIQSFSDEGSTLDQRTAWAVVNVADEYPIWDTVNTDLAGDEDYSPTMPGDYTWPLDGSVSYYSTIVAGPLPPLECASSVPAGTEMVGCFSDSSLNRLLNSATRVSVTKGAGGMTTQMCAEFCFSHDYFGLEYASECYCGTAEEFEGAVESDQCGRSYDYLCTGDSTTACGGWNSISVYRRKYSVAGCFQDDQSSRIMQLEGSAYMMSAEICYQLCKDGANTHFGTQYGSECWCAVDADLTTNGDVLPSSECSMLCAGSTSNEKCGGIYKMSAYTIDHVPTPGYVGCYEDKPDRAMDAEGKYITDGMTNEVCISYCADKGHPFAGTQYSIECWCGDSFDLYGELPDDLCSDPCEGDAQQVCGGSYALSVYKTT